MQRSGIDTISTTPDPGYQWESDKLTVDTTNESQAISPFPAGDHKAHLNRRAQRHSKYKTEQKHKRSRKEVISLTQSLNPRCFSFGCNFNDYETNAKGPYMTPKVSGHFDHVM